MNTTTKRRGGLDWSAKHTPLTGTLNATGGLLATGMVGALAELPPTWAAAGAGVGAGGHLIASAGQTTRTGMLHRAVCWAGAGGWLAYALSTSPWSASSLASLTCLGVVGGATARLARAAQQREQEQRHRLVLATRRARTAHEWEDRLARVCGVKGAEVIGVEQWAEGTGYTLEVTLPEGGTTWRDLAASADRLAADADLPEGCGVEVAPGVSRRVALIRVSTVDALAEDILYPDDHTPLTINNPLPIGVHRDRSVAAISLRQDSGLLTGQRGGGKTNQLQVINAGLVRCVDALVWHIDLNGGGMSLPWIYPWHELGPEGGVPVPAIDWVASTPAEARKMTAAALRIAKGRKVAYRKLMREAGDDKLPVSRQVPEIVIVVDECAEVLGDNTPHRDVQANLEEIQRIGRACGVNLLVCGLRATSDIIGSAAVKKLSRARISMRVSDPEELNHLFGWNCKATPEDIPYPGCGLYLQDTSGQPRPFKGYRLVGPALERLAVAVAGIRPALDEPSVELAGQDYITRWQRAGHLFSDDDTPADSAATSQQGTPTGTTTAAAGDAEGVNWADPASWPTLAVPGLTAPASTAGLPELVRRLLAVFDAAGAERLHTATLAQALNTTPETLATLLPQIGIKALPNPFSVDGERARGYARADIQAVAERIQRGELDVPPAVAAWPHD